MVRVSVSETYDLSTQTNKISLIGIHTPDKSLIQKTYPGLCMNSKYCRILSQDVVIACASMEPADPLQIGTAPGAIAPEDMFNPILYKAVSNASMSQIEYRMRGLSVPNQTNTIVGHQAIVDNDEVANITDEFPVYYALLSNRDGFRTANPQQGFEMRGLVPLVFERLDNAGIWASASGGSVVANNSFPVISKNSDGELTTDNGVNIYSMRGNAKPMPRFPTTILTGASPTDPGGTQGTNWQYNGMGNGSPVNEQIQMPEIPICYTACIIVPPSKLHKLYYRLVVRTYLEFSEVRPITEITGFYGLATDVFPEVYYSDYRSISKEIADIRSTQVDVKSADLNKIMEGS